MAKKSGVQDLPHVLTWSKEMNVSYQLHISKYLGDM